MSDTKHKSLLRAAGLSVLPGLAIVLGAHKCVVLEREHARLQGQARVAIVHYRALLQATPVIENRLNDLEARPQWKTQYIAQDRGGAAGLLVADLSSLRQVMGLTATAGAPQSVEGAPPGAMDVRLSFITTIEVLQRFLEAIEQQPHLLRVAALKVKAGPVAGADGNARLTVQCVVRGHWRPPSEAL